MSNKLEDALKDLHQLVSSFLALGNGYAQEELVSVKVEIFCQQKETQQSSLEHAFHISSFNLMLTSMGKCV